MAPYLLATAPIEVDEAAGAAVRAVLAEPRLAAATLWPRQPELVRAAVERLRWWPAVPRRWRAAMSEAWLATAGGEEVATGADSRYLVLEIDREAAIAWSLHAFRRRPWPTRLVRVEVSAAGLEKLDLTPAANLPETGIEAFESGCLEAAHRSSDPGEGP
jgi:hypothetical protein